MEHYTYNTGETQDCVARCRSVRDWAMVLLAYSGTDVPPKQGFFIDQVFEKDESEILCRKCRNRTGKLTCRELALSSSKTFVCR